MTAAAHRTSDDPSGDAPFVAAAKRNPDAFARLYERYERRIFAYCLRRLGEVNAAEDAASLVFTRAFAKLASCDDCRFRAWLFAIANNVIIDRIRSPRPLERSLGDALHVADPQRGPEAAALASEAAR